MLAISLARLMLHVFEMPKTILHVERKSRFLRTLLPIYPYCQEIRFGLLDCAAIGFAFVCFAGSVFILTW
jgi:hypothetical protein